MLSPIRPEQGSPEYEKRLRDYTQALRDRKKNPHNWGVFTNLNPEPTSGKKSVNRKS